jgi:hypothetical protein
MSRNDGVQRGSIVAMSLGMLRNPQASGQGHRSNGTSRTCHVGAAMPVCLMASRASEP